MKTLKLALLAGAFALTPVAAIAQDVGATIYGSDGNAVGTVAEVNADVVVIDTGKHKAPVPATMLTDGEKGKSVNATKDQIDTLMDQRIAEANTKRDAALVEGAAVVTVGGGDAGKLGKVDLAADSVELVAPEGTFPMKKEHFAVNPQGKLMVLFSKEQIAAAAAAAPAGGQ